MPKNRLLIIEDEEDIQELLAYNLAREGFVLSQVGTGEQGLQRARSELPELILLDLMLPGIGGLDVCRALKNDPATRHIPVIMVTAKGEESDIVTGLELGADDYVTKPFSPRILVARVRTVLRRRQQVEDEADMETLVRGGLRIDSTRHEVTIHGEKADLTATEFQVLYFLARRPGWVFTRQQIVDEVKGSDYPVTERAVDVQLVGLRRKLGELASYVETVRGVGYRFRELE